MSNIVKLAFVIYFSTYKEISTGEGTLQMLDPENGQHQIIME